MIELYFWLIVVLGFSMLARALYGIAHTPGYKAAFNALAFVGVFVHEIAHYTLGTISGVKPGKRVNLYLFEDSKIRLLPI